MAEEDFGYSTKLPEDIREIFQRLCQDVAFLYNSWNFYLELFSKPENVSLLSDMAGVFARVVFGNPVGGRFLRSGRHGSRSGVTR
jgi:hypothetical protein